MSGKRYTEQFKVEAVRQVTERGYPLAEVAKRLGITSKSLYDWKAKYDDSSGEYQKSKAASDEIKALKAELKRVTMGSTPITRTFLKRLKAPNHSSQLDVSSADCESVQCN